MSSTLVETDDSRSTADSSIFRAFGWAASSVTLWQIQRREHLAVEEAVNIDKLDEAARQVDVAATRSRTRRRE